MKMQEVKMKKTAMTVAAIMVLVLTPVNTISAGESISMTISCTIPAIPGLNAPMIEEEIQKTDTPVEAEALQQKELKPEALTNIQKDSQEQKIITEGQTDSFAIVKTIYHR